MGEIYSSVDMSLGDACVPVSVKNGKTARAVVVVPATADGAPLGQDVGSLVAGGVVAQPRPFFGGDYLIRAFATNWNGGSAKIQFLDADAATFTDLVNPDNSVVPAFTANRTQAAGLGANAILRAVVTGAPVGLYIVASKMP